MTTEIERKWLCDRFPDLPYESEELQTQAYLSFMPVTVRIRKTEKSGKTTYVLAVKGKGKLSRTEVEFAMDKEQYEALFPLTLASAQKRLRRYRLPGGEVLECSLVDEGEEGAFFYAEVEFGDEESAKRFVPPPFVGKEVTWESGYSMGAYCKTKIPDSQREEANAL